MNSIHVYMYKYTWMWGHVPTCRLLHSQDSPRVPKRRDALSSHPSSSMAPSSLFSRLARLAVCLANMSLLATAEVSTKPWVQKVFYAMGPEEITLACPVGFSFNCKSICCDWPYMDPRTCAEFGVNFTKAKQLWMCLLSTSHHLIASEHRHPSCHFEGVWACSRRQVYA